MVAKYSAIARRAKQIPSEYLLFMGDSHVERLAVQLVDPWSINAGVGSDTTVGILRRITDYEPLDRWSCVVIWVGFNDLQFRSVDQIRTNFRALVGRIGSEANVLILELLPINEQIVRPYNVGKNAQIQQLNTLLEDMASELENVSFVPLPSQLYTKTGELDAAVQTGDGVHLNNVGLSLVKSHLQRRMGHCRRQASPDATPKANWQPLRSDELTIEQIRTSAVQLALADRNNSPARSHSPDS